MQVVADGAVRRLQEEHNRRAWLAWHIAALQRAKRIPELSRLQIDVGGAAKTQTRQQQIEAAKMIAKMLGGKVRKLGKTVPIVARQ